MPLFELLLIFIAGLVGGVFGTLVGGGNMIVMPLLLFLGFPAIETIAISRFGVLGLTMSGYYKFQKKGLVNHKIAFFIMIFAVIGSFIGTSLVLTVDDALLERLIGIIILVMLAFAFMSKNVGMEAKKLGKMHYVIGGFLSLVLGLYIGFIGLAAGTFLIYLSIFVFGLTFLQSAATIKIPGFVSSLVAVGIFWFNDKIIWSIAILLFIAMFIGSYIGAHYSDKIGNVWLRRLFMIVVGIMALRLLF